MGLLCGEGQGMSWIYWTLIEYSLPVFSYTIMQYMYFANGECAVWYCCLNALAIFDIKETAFYVKCVSLPGLWAPELLLLDQCWRFCQLRNWNIPRLFQKWKHHSSQIRLTFSPFCWVGVGWGKLTIPPQPYRRKDWKSVLCEMLSHWW